VTVISIIVIFAWGFAMGLSWNISLDNAKWFVFGGVVSTVAVYGLSWVIKDILHRFSKDGKQGE
jgi:hypothetical protein